MSSATEDAGTGRGPRATGTTRVRGATRGRTGAPEAPPRRRAAPPAPARPARRRPAPVGNRGATGPGTRPPRVPFVLLILGLLGGAMVSLLVLQAVLAEDAHTIAELQRENRELSREQEALLQEVVHAESPEALAQRAEELGMEPGEAPLFLDLESGRILGDPPGEGATGEGQ